MKYVVGLITISTFLIWIFVTKHQITETESYAFTHSSHFLYWLLILKPRHELMWLFIISLSSSIYVFLRHADSTRYLIVFSTSVLIQIGLIFTFLSPLTFNFLKKSYEFTSVSDIVDNQLQTGGLYLSAVNTAEFQYKLELYKRMKPEIVALGSSRVLQFRQHHFKKRFLNMGRTITALEDQEIINEMMRIHKPEYILFGLDHFWFNIPPNKSFPNNKNRGTELNPYKIFIPLKWIMDDKITATQFIQIAGGADRVAGVDTLSYGVAARHGTGGYAKDGSHYYYSEITAAPRGGEKKGFSHFEKLIEEANTGYAFPGDSIKSEKWRLVAEIMDTIQKNGVKIIVFLPPVAHPVYKKIINSKKFGYISELKTFGQKFNVPFYDFLDPRSLTMDQCEFLDGIHGGEIVALKMLLTFAADRPNEFGRILDKAKLLSMVQKYGGRVLIPVGPAENIREVDFLGLGCPKQTMAVTR